MMKKLECPNCKNGLKKIATKIRKPFGKKSRGKLVSAKCKLCKSNIV